MIHDNAGEQQDDTPIHLPQHKPYVAIAANELIAPYRRRARQGKALVLAGACSLPQNGIVLVKCDGREYPINRELECRCQDARSTSEDCCKHVVAAIIYGRVLRILATRTPEELDAADELGAPEAFGFVEPPVQISFKVGKQGVHDLLINIRDTDDSSAARRTNEILSLLQPTLDRIGYQDVATDSTNPEPETEPPWQDAPYAWLPEPQETLAPEASTQPRLHHGSVSPGSDTDDAPPWCHLHNCAQFWREKNGRRWHNHVTDEGFCDGVTVKPRRGTVVNGGR